MKRRLIGILMLALLLQAGAGRTQTAEDRETADCGGIIALLEKQREDLGRELRQIKREIIVLRESGEKPGLREIIGGIGYIAGIFGVGFYLSARRREHAHS